MDDDSIAVELRYLGADIRGLKEIVTTQLVTRREFKPVQAIVYGGVAMVLVGTAGGVLALVFN